MELTGVTVTENVIAITIINTVSNLTFPNFINFEDCLFDNINAVKPGSGLILVISYGLQISQIMMDHCRFSNINSSVIIRTYVKKAWDERTLGVIIQNSSFSHC